MDRIPKGELKTYDHHIPAHLRSQQSFTKINHNIHPGLKPSEKFIGHHAHIRELASHVLRNVPNHEHVIKQTFGDPKKEIMGQPFVQRNYDTKFQIPWL